MPKIPKKDYIDSVGFPHSIELHPIGVIHSPYKERHGTPRQAVIQEPTDYQPVTAEIEIFSHIPSVALKDLDGFDKIWILSWLHLNTNWNPTVTPPRGPKVKRGTLATRSPHRPNPIGLSAATIVCVKNNRIIVEGIDLLDQTPILDIKPYVTYCDAFPAAKSGYVDELEIHRHRELDIFGKKDI